MSDHQTPSSHFYSSPYSWSSTSSFLFLLLLLLYGHLSVLTFCLSGRRTAAPAVYSHIFSSSECSCIFCLLFFPTASWWDVYAADLRAASLFSDVFGTPSRITSPFPALLTHPHSQTAMVTSLERRNVAALWIQRAGSVLATPLSPDATHNNLNAIRHECVWCGLSALKMHNDKLKRVKCCTKCRVQLPLLFSLHRCCCDFVFWKDKRILAHTLFMYFLQVTVKLLYFCWRECLKNENVHFIPQSYWNEFWRWINNNTEKDFVCWFWSHFYLFLHICGIYGICKIGTYRMLFSKHHISMENFSTLFLVLFILFIFAVNLPSSILLFLHTDTMLSLYHFTTSGRLQHHCCQQPPCFQPTSITVIFFSWKVNEKESKFKIIPECLYFIHPCPPNTPIITRIWCWFHFTAK